MNTLRKIVKKIDRRRQKALLWSFVIAVGLSVLSYILNNQPLFTGENLEQYTLIEWVKGKIINEDKEETLVPLYINVSYDKQLTEKRDEYHMSIGHTTITDRQKLLTLLKMLRSTGQYKYIFLDVRFEKGNNTDVDSALFEEIRHMDRIVLANHSDMEMADAIPAEKAAINEYSVTTTTSFVRYVFSHGGKPSMALYAYTDITGNTISKHGWLYMCNGRLCYNSHFVRFPAESFAKEYREDGKKIYYHLGADILENNDESSLAVLTRGKYIVIGDFVEDVHDTYAGSRPGPIITFYAFRALMNGEQMVSWWVILFFLAVYFCISLSMFSRHSWLEFIPYAKKTKMGYFCLSLIGYGAVLTMIAIVLNLFWNISASIFVPSVCFAIQNLIMNYKRTKI